MRTFPKIRSLPISGEQARVQERFVAIKVINPKFECDPNQIDHENSKKGIEEPFWKRVGKVLTGRQFDVHWLTKTQSTITISAREKPLKLATALADE